MLDKILLGQIEEFCRLNNIQDVDKVVNRCLMDGFNILKYGLDPIDNKNIELGLKNNLNEFYEKHQKPAGVTKHQKDSEPRPMETREVVKENVKEHINKQEKDVKSEQEEKKPVIKRRRIKVVKNND